MDRPSVVPVLPYLRALGHLSLSFCLKSTPDEWRAQVSGPEQVRKEVKRNLPIEESRKAFRRFGIQGMPQTFSRTIATKAYVQAKVLNL